MNNHASKTKHKVVGILSIAKDGKKVSSAPTVHTMIPLYTVWDNPLERKQFLNNEAIYMLVCHHSVATEDIC